MGNGDAVQECRLGLHLACPSILATKPLYVPLEVGFPFAGKCQISFGHFKVLLAVFFWTKYFEGDCSLVSNLPFCK